MGFFEDIYKWYDDTTNKVENWINGFIGIKPELNPIQAGKNLINGVKNAFTPGDQTGTPGDNGAGGGSFGMKGEQEIVTPNPNISETPTLQDKTEENIEQSIGGVGQSDVFKYMVEMQQRQWEREDLIRKETQEREDNAYQRMVEDMKKAGINPNIFQGTPSASGGGISQATGINYAALDNEIKEKLTLLQQEIDNSFKGEENEKDRFANILENVLQLFLFKGLAGK